MLQSFPYVVSLKQHQNFLKCSIFSSTKKLFDKENVRLVDTLFKVSNKQTFKMLVLVKM